MDICLNCFGELDRAGVCTVCKRRCDERRASLLTLAPRTFLDKRYMVARILGMGGFGITYLAWDIATETRVAIKEFFPKGFATRVPLTNQVTVIDKVQKPSFEHWLSAFEQEAQILFSIAHLHGVVKLLDFFKENGTAYIVMDFLEGISLRRYTDLRGGVLPINDALSIMRPVMESLVVLHQAGIIHKDISPENIQIVRNKAVKLIDFGAASIYTQQVVKPYIVLKKGYSPIELYSYNMPQGPWSDIYEVGATLYNIITGILPQDSPSRLQRDMLLRPSKLGVRIPLPQENSLMKALSVDYRNRYTNSGEFIQMLYGEILKFVRTITIDFQ